MSIRLLKRYSINMITTHRIFNVVRSQYALVPAPGARMDVRHMAIYTSEEQAYGYALTGETVRRTVAVALGARHI